MTRFNVYFSDPGMRERIRKVAKKLGYTGPCDLIRRATTDLVLRYEARAK